MSELGLIHRPHDMTAEDMTSLPTHEQYALAAHLKSEILADCNRSIATAAGTEERIALITRLNKNLEAANRLYLTTGFFARGTAANNITVHHRDDEPAVDERDEAAHCL